jgi:hypothetical protein
MRFPPENLTQKSIHDYYLLKPADCVLVDGLQGFQSGPVPMGSRERETDKMNMRIILGGKDAIAVDSACALIAGWDPDSIGYLNLLRQSHAGDGNPSSMLVLGEQVSELRKSFTLRFPNLGRIPIDDAGGPDLELGEMEIQGNFLTLSYLASDDAVKAEIHVNGQIRELLPSSAGVFKVDVTGISVEEAEVRVFDRLLNMTCKTAVSQVSKSR